MAQLLSWLQYIFKEISNDTSHAQIRVKMKKLWPQQVGEEKQVTKQKLCRDISRFCRDKASNKARNFVTTNLDYVATKLEDKLCRDKAKDKLCRNKVFLLRQSFSIATKFFLSRQSFSIAIKFFSCDKVIFIATKFFYHYKVFMSLKNFYVVTKFYFVATK